MHPDKDLQLIYITEVTKKDILSGLESLGRQRIVYVDGKKIEIKDSNVFLNRHDISDDEIVITIKRLKKNREEDDFYQDYINGNIFDMDKYIDENRDHVYETLSEEDDVPTEIYVDEQLAESIKYYFQVYLKHSLDEPPDMYIIDNTGDMDYKKAKNNQLPGTVIPWQELPPQVMSHPSLRDRMGKPPGVSYTSDDNRFVFYIKDPKLKMILRDGVLPLKGNFESRKIDEDAFSDMMYFPPCAQWCQTKIT